MVRAMRNDAALREYRLEPQVDLEVLSTEELEAMAEAGREVVEVYRVLAKTGDNVVGELLRGHETFYEWDHYPPGDVYDRESHSQFYYHAHPTDQRFDQEHGHFHTFIRPKGMPPGMTPAPVPDFKMPDDPNDALSHLIAVAMNPAGFPFRLFTVNRWVTGEVWYTATDVCNLLDRFEIDHAQPSWPVNRWLTAMLCLFRPQVRELVVARDCGVARWAECHAGRDVYEDRELEVTSFADISVEDHIRAVARALLARR